MNLQDIKPVWTPQGWKCPGIPADEKSYVYLCCPSGVKRVHRKAFQSYGAGGYSAYNQLCKGDSPDVIACGPKPPGDVVCCQNIRQWRQNRGPDSCPIGEAASGLDYDFLARIGAIRPQQNNARKNALLGLGGIAFLGIAGTMLYHIFKD